jgi:hypothetical protein
LTPLLDQRTIGSDHLQIRYQSGAILPAPLVAGFFLK